MIDKKKAWGIIRDDSPMPNDFEAEMAVIAAMIVEPKPAIDNAVSILGSGSGFFDIKAKQHGRPAIFYNPRHQRIYSTLCEMDDKEMDIDFISLVHILKQKKILDDVGGETYLTEIINSIATTANLETWCNIVRNCAIRRNIIALGGKMSDKAYDDENEVSTLLDSVEKEVMEISKIEQRSEIKTIKELIDPKNKDGAVKHLLNLRENLNNVMGIPSGYFDLNRKITGFKPGEMFVLAARPSIGKTSFALNLVSNIAINTKEPVPVGFFSLEMTAEQLSRRLLCSQCGYSERDFIDGNVRDFEFVKESARQVGNSPIYIDPTPALKTRELRSKARTMKSKYDIKIIFIDYLQLMKAEVRSDNRQEEVSAISSGVKALAKELNIPIIVLAQLNREVEKVAGMKPRLNHLRESGAIEQDADIVAFLHREKDEQHEKTEGTRTKGLKSELIIGKNRNGETGTVDLLFFPHVMQFRNKSRIDEEDVPQR